MSLRHLSRLKQNELPAQEHVDDLEDDPEDDPPTSKTSAFQLLDSSDEESGDGGDEEDEDDNEDDDDEKSSGGEPGPGDSFIRIPTPPVVRKAKGRKGTVDAGDAEDEMGSEDTGNKRTKRDKQDSEDSDPFEGFLPISAQDARSVARSPLLLLGQMSWLQLDARSLNVDNELKSRFGGSMGQEGGGNNRRQGGGRRGVARGRGQGMSAIAQLYLRKCMMGPPKEEWARSPTFVGGGIRLLRTSPPDDCTDPAERSCDWYRYEHSAAYEQLQRDFETVQSTHDPNSLAIFLAHHPYHVEGLLTLGMLFAHTGQLERAGDYVRRCVFVLESAYCEAYRPAENLAPFRMDMRIAENRPYFMALFRHIQMVGGRGLYRTALEVSKLLLSLDPYGDPTGILLAIDYFAIRAFRGDFLLELCHSDLEVRGSVAASEEEEEEEGEEGESGDEMDEEISETKDKQPLKAMPVSALPNLCYSCALAYAQAGKRKDALRVLKDALRRFPCVLPPLLARCRHDLGSRVTQPWDSVVLRHAFFSGASSRLPSGHVLLHLATIYTVRSVELWKTEEALDLLFEAAVDVLRQLDTKNWAYEDEEEELMAHYPLGGCAADRYLAASPADFRDEFESLPGDMNPLDPALMDPAIARRGRLRILQPGVQRQWQQRREFFMMQGQRLGGAQGNLNPDLPLLELFWRTLLPWNTIDSSRRRPA